MTWPTKAERAAKALEASTVSVEAVDRDTKPANVLSPREVVVPPFTVAYVLPLEPITIPGVKPSPGQRIDPMLPEWEGWRIVVAGASVLLIAPPGWVRGVVGPDGDLTEEFAPVAQAHGWASAQDVRQVFEIPRSKLLIRYYVDARAGDVPDAEFAEAIRARAIAAPDDRTRAAWVPLARRRQAEEAADRAESAPAPKAKPRAKAPAPVAAPRRAVSVDDGDAGTGDEGPETDET